MVVKVSINVVLGYCQSFIADLVVELDWIQKFTLESVAQYSQGRQCRISCQDVTGTDKAGEAFMMSPAPKHWKMFDKMITQPEIRSL